jgi:hypothetical protein
MGERVNGSENVPSTRLMCRAGRDDVLFTCIRCNARQHQERYIGCITIVLLQSMSLVVGCMYTVDVCLAAVESK